MVEFHHSWKEKLEERVQMKESKECMRKEQGTKEQGRHKGGVIDEAGSRSKGEVSKER